MKNKKVKCTYCKRKSIGSFVSTGDEEIYYCVRHKPKK